MKKVLGWILRIVLVLVIAFAVLLLFLTVTEYRPADREVLEVAHEGNTPGTSAGTGTSLTILTWNMGYGALGDNADFFMDGGSHVNTADTERVNENVEGIIEGILAGDADVVFLQEVDQNSMRSHRINEAEEIEDALSQKISPLDSTFAWNFRVKFIPYPIPPIGEVNSGIMTLTKLSVTESTRIQLPCPFSWPVRLGNLKRCLMADRVPVVDSNGNDTGKELVLVNLHLEAYDSGEGKIAQTNQLREFLETEREKGNYVIAGGDFNQKFSSIDTSMYPEKEGTWHCGELDVTEFDPSWQFAMDNRTPSCRSLDQPYAGADEETFQYYLIDGFIVSDNIQIHSVETKDYQFENTDHNPVELKVTLK